MLTKEDNENFVVIPSDGSSLAVKKQSDKNLIAKLEDLGYRANASLFSFRISHLVSLQQFSAVEFVKFLQNNQTTWLQNTSGFWKITIKHKLYKASVEKHLFKKVMRSPYIAGLF